MGENIVVAKIKRGNPRFVYSEFQPESFKGVIDDVKQGRYTVFSLPKPLDDIKIIHQVSGRESFMVRFNVSGYEVKKHKTIFNKTVTEFTSLTPREQTYTVIGDALVVAFTDGQYKGLSQEEYKRIVDCKAINFDFDASDNS